MIRKPISFPWQVGLGIASILVVLGLYLALAARQHRVNPKDTTIPNPAQFAEGWKKILPRASLSEVGAAERSVGQWVDSSWLLSDTVATFTRLFAGVFWGVLLSLIVGMAMGCFPAVEAFFAPPLSFFARIPPTAMLAVYFVLFGTEERLFVAMIALGVFPTLAQSIFQAARKDISEHAISKAYTLGASHAEVVWNIVFAQVLPRIIENVRLQIGPAMVFLIAAEWMVADVGFGYRLRIQSRLLNMNVVYIYLAVLGVTGYLLDWLLSRLRRWWCPWFGV